MKQVSKESTRIEEAGEWLAASSLVLGTTRSEGDFGLACHCCVLKALHPDISS